MGRFYTGGFLILAAILLPIFCGYFISFIFLCWLVATGAWRSVCIEWFGPDRNASQSSPHLDQILAPMHWGVLGWVAFNGVSAIGGYFLSDYASGFLAVIRQGVHTVIKSALLWFVLAAAMRAMLARGVQIWRFSLPFVVWLGAYFVYSLIQRKTGIDLVHGIDARLGSHRFAYDVYRISGLMGHPLTLTYNVMLLGLTASGLFALPNQGRQRRVIWGCIASLSLLMLLFSGSRFVFLPIVAALVLGSGGRLVKYWKWIGIGIVFAATIVWFEGSLLGRFGEIFDKSIPLTERFPRLVFWKVHWQMFLDNPVTGVTVAGLDAARNAYYTAIGYHDKMYTAHNIFLQILADTGLLGLTGLICLAMGFLRMASNLGRLYGWNESLKYLWWAVFISGLVQNNLRDSEFLYALWVLTAFSIVLIAETHRLSGKNERKQA